MSALEAENMRLRNLLSRHLMLPYCPKEATGEMADLRGDILDALDKPPATVHMFTTEGLTITLPPEYNRGYAAGFERALKTIEGNVAEAREWIKQVQS